MYKLDRNSELGGQMRRNMNLPVLGIDISKKKFDVALTNRLDDGFDASPAVVDKEIYLRGRRYLYRISES